MCREACDVLVEKRVKDTGKISPGRNVQSGRSAAVGPVMWSGANQEEIKTRSWIT